MFLEDLKRNPKDLSKPVAWTHSTATLIRKSSLKPSVWMSVPLQKTSWISEKQKKTIWWRGDYFSAQLIQTWTTGSSVQDNGWEQIQSCWSPTLESFWWSLRSCQDLAQPAAIAPITFHRKIRKLTERLEIPQWCMANGVNTSCLTHALGWIQMKSSIFLRLFLFNSNHLRRKPTKEKAAVIAWC